MRSSRSALLVPLPLLILGALLFHVPALLNARDLTSDSAIVGLQARHMLHGEFSPFLWGAGYQSSFDALLAAGLFAIFGSHAITLMLVPLLGYLLVLALTYFTLARHIETWRAAVCCVPIVIIPWAVNTITVAPPRMWCITLSVASVWLMDGASRQRRADLWLAAGASLAGLALYVDLFALVLLPGLAVLAALCVFESKRGSVHRAVSTAVGAAIGAAVFVVSRMSADSTSAPAGFALDHVRSNLSLLFEKCLPYALGYGLFHDNVLPAERTIEIPAAPWGVLLAIGGWSLVALLLAGAATLFTRKVDWPLRRIGLFGAVVVATTACAFPLSMMPADFWSARYLGPLFWAAPFALAPLAAWLSTRQLAAAILPYAIVAAIGGWIGYGNWTNHGWPHVSVRASADDERQLVMALRQHGIAYAACDYWLAYRLDFLYDESPIFIPILQQQDRYQPWHEEAVGASRMALIYHPNWSSIIPLAGIEKIAATSGQSERIEVAGFTVFLLTPPQ